MALNSSAEYLAIIKDLRTTEPGPGLRQILLRLTVLVPLVALSLSAWWQRAWLAFGLAALCTGLWYAAMLMTTHDAVHRTFTGVAWLDELWGRAVSWPVLWIHASFTQIHLLHHKMNGLDLADPERVDPTPEDYARAGALGRWYYRHRILVDMFGSGAAGLILQTLRNAWRFRDQVRGMRRLLLQDLVGAALSFGGLHLLAWVLADRAAPGSGAFMVAGTLTLWLFIERITGAAMHLRKHVEHSGCWQTREHFFETQLQSCRNITTNAVMGWYFSQLAYHSVHHAFPRIPFYKLREAHERILSACGPMPTARGYWGALREVVARSRGREALLSRG